MAFTSGTPSGQISLSQVQTEFGGSNPVEIDEHYGCAYQVPTSGQISLDNLRGKYRYWGGCKFQPLAQTANTTNDRVEANGTVYGWRILTYTSTGITANPGCDGAGIRADGTHRMIGRNGVIVEKLFWYLYASSWRLYIQTYNFNTPYDLQAGDAAAAPYNDGVRVSMDNDTYTQTFSFGGTPGNGGSNPYKTVVGDLSRRRVYAWFWSGSVSFNNYVDFQWTSTRG